MAYATIHKHAQQQRPRRTAGAGFGMVLISLVIGFVVGLVTWALLSFSSWLTDLVWGGSLADSLPWFMPLLICAMGGLVIGLWSQLAGGEPVPVEEVMEQVGQTGDFEVCGLGRRVVGFLLPVVFGGSVSPEAGILGIVTTACSWAGNALRQMGYRARAVSDLAVSAVLSAVFGTPLLGVVATAEHAMPSEDADANRLSPIVYTRVEKIALYAAAAVGSLCGISLVSALFGRPWGLPDFDPIEARGAELVWFGPAVVVGYVLALAYHFSNTCFRHLGLVLERNKVVRATLCGVLLGAVGVAMPDVLFSGAGQTAELMGEWERSGAALLFATGLLKAILTPLCLNMGWRGSYGFPAVFAGVAAGYGLALLVGADPMLCVTAVTACTLAGVVRRPLVALAMLCLCFPGSGIVWMGLACVLGATLPMPRSWLA